MARLAAGRLAVALVAVVLCAAGLADAWFDEPPTGGLRVRNGVRETQKAVFFSLYIQASCYNDTSNHGENVCAGWGTPQSITTNFNNDGDLDFYVTSIPPVSSSKHADQLPATDAPVQALFFDSIVPGNDGGYREVGNVTFGMNTATGHAIMFENIGPTADTPGPVGSDWAGTGQFNITEGTGVFEGVEGGVTLLGYSEGDGKTVTFLVSAFA